MSANDYEGTDLKQRKVEPPNQEPHSVAVTAKSGTVDQDKDPESDTHSQQALLVIVSELCFIALPFVVYVFVLTYIRRLHTIFSLSEWAFASVLLLGQSLARFFTLLMSGRKPKITGKPLIVFVLTLVFGLIPSVIVLVFNLLGTEQGKQTEPPTVWFPNAWVVIQIILFAAALIVYFILVGAYEYSNSERENRALNTTASPSVTHDERGR